MKIIKQTAYVISASSLLVGLTATPVFAQNGERHTGADDVAASTATTISAPTDDHGNASRTPDETQPDDTAKAQFKQDAQKKIADLRKTAKAETQAAREDSCNAHKKGAEQRISSISANVTRFQSKLDTILTKTQDYVTTNNVTVTNYDALVAAAKSAQTASATSIATLKDLKPSIDCTQTTNAENVASFRTAAQDSRDKLKTYMRSLKDLLKAVREAKQSATSTTTQTESKEGTN
jgi:hypothetical protein